MVNYGYCLHFVSQAADDCPKEEGRQKTGQEEQFNPIFRNPGVCVELVEMGTLEPVSG